jgi:pimeloyl-ACP methyl ester carboxylesterase
MFVHETGEGLRGVVGFHGWSGDHRTFAPLWNRMPEGWVFFSFDLPGCGVSEKPAEWNFRALAREVATEVVQLGMRDLVLVGSCSGAILTAFVARELREMGRPEVTARLVMIDPFAYCPWYFQLFLLPLLGYLIYATAFANPIGRGITNFFLQNKRAGDTDLTESFAGVDHRVTWRYLKMLFECGRPGQFQGMGIPVDILYGEKTFSAVRRSVQEWKEALPQAKVKELSGVGHLPIAEGTGEVAKVVFKVARCKASKN